MLNFLKGLLGKLNLIYNNSKFIQTMRHISKYNEEHSKVIIQSTDYDGWKGKKTITIIDDINCRISWGVSRRCSKLAHIMPSYPRYQNKYFLWIYKKTHKKETSTQRIETSSHWRSGWWVFPKGYVAIVIEFRTIT